MSDIERIARLKMSLQEIEPVIWRQVEVPVTSSLKAVHDVIQAALGWKTITSSSSRSVVAATATPLTSAMTGAIRS